jgi:hypothetical protein
MKSATLAACFLAVIALPVGGTLHAKSALAAPHVRAVHRCANTQISIQPQTSQGAAGHIAIIYRIHNLAGQACTLYGYPGIQLLDRNFKSLPTAVHRGAGNLVGPIPPQLVRVAPHSNAYFAMGYSDVPVNNQPCPTAYYLMIFAPNDFLPVVSYASGHHGSIVACSGNLYVTPVTAQPRYQ